MFLHELHGPSHWEQIQKTMQKAGYTELGSGADATVWGKDAGSVIKILMPEEGDLAPAEQVFLEYYKTAQKYRDNPHFMKFINIGGKHYTKFDIDGETFYQIAVEKLQPLPNNSFEEAIVWAFSELVASKQSWPEAVKHTSNPDDKLWQFWEGDNSDAVAKRVASMSKTGLKQLQYLYLTMQLMYQIGRKQGFGWDLHTENAMLRNDGTIVITDPWYSTMLGENFTQTVVESEEIPQEIYNLLDELTADDTGSEDFGNYVLRFEGFTDWCQQDAAERCDLPDNDPRKLKAYDDVYTEVLDGWIKEQGSLPVDRGFSGSEDYPVQWAIFKKQGVTEAFDAPYPMSWEHDDGESHDALVKLPDGTNLSIMFSVDYGWSGDELWTVEFWRNNSQDVTGEGDAQRIFATVLSAIQQFIDFEKPEHIQFSASKETDAGDKNSSRSSLYTNLVKRYARSWGYDVDVSDRASSVGYDLHRMYKGVAEGTLNEYRNALYDFVKSKFPTWPEYVLKDFLYAQAKGIRNEEELKDWLERNQKDFGQVKWRLEKLPITLDIFTPKTQRMIKQREGGSSNPFQVPRDAERHAQQLKMIQQQGVRTEPIIVAKLNNGYDLIEGWHRTIQHLQQYPKGYTGPAWVAYGATYTSESKQGVTESLESRVELGDVQMKKTSVGDTVKYFGEKVKIVGLNRDTDVARITTGSKTWNVRLSDLKPLGQGVTEGTSKVTYTKPNFDREWEEAERYPEFQKAGKDTWINIAKQGSVAKWSELRDVGNVDTDLSGLERDKIKRAGTMVGAGKVELPIVGRWPDGYLDLIAGNTRIATLLSQGHDPKVWVVDVPEEQGVAEGLDEAVGDNYLYHATQPAGMMRILRTGVIKASYRPQEATKARTQYPTVSTTRSKQYAESDEFTDFLNLPKEGNSVIIVFDRNAVANHFKMFSTSQGTQTVGDEFEEVIVVPKGTMPIRGTMKGFYFNPGRTQEIQEFQDTPWFKELLTSPYYMGPKQGVAEDLTQGRNLNPETEKYVRDHKWKLTTVNPMDLDTDAFDDPYNRVIDIDVDHPVNFKDPIIVDANGVIIDGFHRAYQAQQQGLKQLPAYVPVKDSADR